MAAARATDQIQFLQLYVEKDRAASKATVEKANELGFSGLFLTVRCLISTIMCSFCLSTISRGHVLGHTRYV